MLVYAYEFLSQLHFLWQKCILKICRHILSSCFTFSFLLMCPRYQTFPSVLHISLYHLTFCRGISILFCSLEKKMVHVYLGKNVYLPTEEVEYRFLSLAVISALFLAELLHYKDNFRFLSLFNNLFNIYSYGTSLIGCM